MAEFQKVFVGRVQALPLLRRFSASTTFQYRVVP
jgi:hypothetical protein